MNCYLEDTYKVSTTTRVFEDPMQEDLIICVKMERKNNNVL